MTNKFRKHLPTNTCTKLYNNYRDYKAPLTKDFFSKCGYCNDHDSWAGGRRGMQIDHFAPKKKFAHLINDYSNLIYACFYCNNNKSDDWVTENATQSICSNGITGYIHPRLATYDKAFTRDESGKIIPQNEVAVYMYTKLALGLKRHALIFLLEKLNDLWLKLHNTMENDNLDLNLKKKLNERKNELANEFLEYFNEYRKTLND